MQYIKSIKENWKIILAFALLFGYAPWHFYQMPYIILGVSVACTYFFSKGRTWVMLIPLLLFLYPSQLETEVAPIAKAVAKKAPSFIEYPIMIAFVYSLVKKKIAKFGNLLLPSALLFLMGIIYSVFYDTREDFVNTLFFLVNYVFVYLLIINSTISIKQYLQVLEVVFIALCSYGILEYFYMLTPYQDLYYVSNGFTFINRASSLCGHPLVLVGFLCFYQIYLYARIVVFGKMPYASIVLLLIVSILTASRTAYLVEGLLLVSYLIYIIKYQRNTKTTYTVMSILIIVSFVLYYFSDQYLASLDRFSNTAVSTENRSSAFIVAWNIFQENILGVGYHLKDIIDKYSHFASGFTMNVLDNVFLALLCRYGILMLVYLYLFMEPIRMTYKRIKKDKGIMFVFILLCVNLLALSFSFIFIDFFPFVLFSSCTIGFIYKLYDYRHNENERYIGIDVNI